MKAKRLLILVLLLASAPIGLAQRVAILRDVKTIQVEPTVVPNPEKVREDFAPNLVADALRNALRSTNFEIGDSPVRAHIVLEEFNSGNLAKRFAIGFGAGRSTVAGRLIFQDGEGKELANIRIRVRGNFLFGGYQGGDTQRRQAANSFDQKLIEEISRLK